MAHMGDPHDAPPADSHPDIYAYFRGEDPPVDNRYQCYCSHPYVEPASSGSSDSEGDKPATYTLRCTNSFTQQDYESGWTLCEQCRPSPALLYARAWQVGECAEQHIRLHDLGARMVDSYYLAYMVNGYYLEATQLNPRLRGVQCRCSCMACDTQGNHHRIVHDFTDAAQRIAQEDVHGWLTGTRPSPTPPMPTPRRPWQIRHATSNAGFNEID